GAAAAGPDLDVRAAALAGKVLADPLDAAAREELVRLRASQRRRDAAACRALAQGLAAYLDAGPQLAAPALRKAAGSAKAASLTRSLAKPLDKIVAALEDAGSPLPGKAKTCRKCGDTGRADCWAYRCNASGMVPCTKCTGSGVVSVERPFPQAPGYALCPDCAGAGVIGCSACGGTGTVSCPACKSRPAANWSREHIAPEEVRRIRQVICKARRLGRGEIDLYTAGALKPSPK
ncbi:MAG: hypothetical protein WBF17_14305, partial [Phycisphaerae bacterium]